MGIARHPPQPGLDAAAPQKATRSSEGPSPPGCAGDPGTSGSLWSQGKAPGALASWGEGGAGIEVGVRRLPRLNQGKGLGEAG